MFKHTCKICNIEFESKYRRCSFCSKQCRTKNNNRVASTRKNQDLPYVSVCHYCDGRITQLRPAKFCNITCRMAFYRVNNKEFNTCEICETELRNGVAKRCKSCKTSNNFTAIHYCTTCSKVLHNTKKTICKDCREKVKRVTKPCETCRKEFTSYVKMNARFCRNQCSPAYKLSKKRNKRADKLRRKRIKLSSKSTKDLSNFYLNVPKDCQVDHIIPLRNGLVSGLHVPWNLQYLSSEDNLLKSNSFDGTYENESWRKDYRR